MRRKIENAVVRVWAKSSAPTGERHLLGVGFLVDTSGHVLTCEHILSGISGGDGEAPLLEADFPLLRSPSDFVPVTIDFMSVDEDIAGLTLRGAVPAGAEPATIVIEDDVAEHKFRAYGIAGKDENGEWALGRISGQGNSRQWVQIESVASTGRRVRQGYSGTAVYDTQIGGVVGMVMKADRLDQDRVAFMLPTKALMNAWSDVLGGAAQRVTPYKGVKAFNEADARLFFGREQIVDDLLRLVQNTSHVSMVADSGAGKTSLIRAGLVPALRAQGWTVVYMPRMGADPHAHLASAILRARTSLPVASTSQGPGDKEVLAETLAKNGLVEEVLHLADGSDTGDVMIILDQFEELYTTCTDDSKREAFLSALNELVFKRWRRGDPRIVVMTAIRSDYLAKLAEYPPAREILTQNQYALSQLSTTDLRRAIEEPAQQLGVSYESGLVDRIIADVEDQPAALPMLEFALNELWRDQQACVITWDAYRRLGGVAEALAKEADRFYESLDEDEKQAAIRVFVQLVNLSRETKGTRRVITRDDVLNPDWRIVEMLAEHAFITLGADEGGKETASLAHESLVEVWPRLAAWVDEKAQQVWRFDREADRVIRRHAAGAVGAAAVPWGDVAAAAVLYASMGQQIGRVYNVDVDRDAAKRIATAMAAGAGAVIASWFAVSNAFKFTGIGYVLSFALEAPLLSALTFVVGNAWKFYFRVRYLGGEAPSEGQMRAIVVEQTRNRLRKMRKGGSFRVPRSPKVKMAARKS